MNGPARLSGASALLVALALASPAGATLEETFTAANEAFWSGELEDAVRGYAELVDLGVRDADLFYNLGTAQARLGRLGASILNLERALLLDPAHLDAAENLAAVRSTLARRRTAGGQDADLDPPRPFWLQLLGRVTAARVGIPFLASWILLFAALSARRLTRRELARLVLLVAAVVLATAALGSGALLASKTWYDSRVQEAIAVGGDEVAVREGPGERFRRAFSCREGDRLRVVDSERDWMLLRDAEGREGWGAARDFGRLRP